MRKFFLSILLISLTIFIASCGRTSGNSNGSDSLIPNHPPQIVNIFIDANNINAPGVINFEARVYDPDDITANLTYLWDFADGTTSNALEPAHTYTYQGEFNYSLTVYDSKGASDIMYAPVTVKIIGGNHRPTITTCNASTVTAQVNQSIDFYGDGSDDAEDIATLIYIWNFGDGSTGSGKNVSHAYTQNGIYTAIFTVSDQHGASISQQLTIGVGVKLPPVITVFNWTPSASLAVPVTVNFSADAYDPDGAIASYYWDFGDGHNIVSQNPTHVYEHGGILWVQLTVYDQDGFVTVTKNVIDIYAEEE